VVFNLRGMPSAFVCPLTQPNGLATGQHVLGLPGSKLDAADPNPKSVNKGLWCGEAFGASLAALAVSAIAAFNACPVFMPMRWARTC
jgi:hypothetical protein